MTDIEADALRVIVDVYVVPLARLVLSVIEEQEREAE